jgi:hypothetical protein
LKDVRRGAASGKQNLVALAAISYAVGTQPIVGGAALP